jgi:hypothetical protein
MPKPQTPAPDALETVTVFRIRRYKDKAGNIVAAKWNTEEVTIRGEVVSRKLHEEAQPLAVAREKWHVLTYRQQDKGEPEKW